MRNLCVGFFQSSFFPHPELQRGESGFPDEEFAEYRLVGESQVIGNFLDIHVGTFQQFPGVCTQEFRHMEADGMPCQLFDDTGKIGG